MTERRNANLFEVLIGQIRQDEKANIVLGKPLRVLSETELVEPVRVVISNRQKKWSAPLPRSSEGRFA